MNHPALPALLERITALSNAGAHLALGMALTAGLLTPELMATLLDQVDILSVSKGPQH